MKSSSWGYLVSENIEFLSCLAYSGSTWKTGRKKRSSLFLSRVGIVSPPGFDGSIAGVVFPRRQHVDGSAPTATLVFGNRVDDEFRVGLENRVEIFGGVDVDDGHGVLDVGRANGVSLEPGGNVSKLCGKEWVWPDCFWKTIECITSYNWSPILLWHDF